MFLAYQAQVTGGEVHPTATTGSRNWPEGAGKVQSYPRVIMGLTNHLVSAVQ